MDKYNELLLDIAKLIADTHRDNFFLKHELEHTKELLERTEEKLENAVALNAVALMANDKEGEQRA